MILDQGREMTLTLPTHIHSLIQLVVCIYNVSWKSVHRFWRRRFSRGFTIYRHGGNLGHVTSNISINFHFIVSESSHICSLVSSIEPRRLKGEIISSIPMLRHPSTISSIFQTAWPIKVEFCVEYRGHESLFAASW